MITPNSAFSPQIAVIVIPTYNEAGTIGKMIDYLCTKTLPSITNWQISVLIVDGNSPDGTAKIVTEKSTKFKNVHLYSETSKDGIGAAYLKGFKYAMEELQADAVFEMDGDFQHPPETIPSMLQALDAGYDYVIGSRKIKGGSNPKGWGFKRIFLSEVGSLAARFILFFPFKNFFKVTDVTTGFKVTRVKGFLDHLNLNFDHLYTKSFGYKLQLLFETLALGAKFKEVPLEFALRTTGESKIEPQAPKEILIAAFKIRWFDPFTQKFLKFGIVGGCGFVVNTVGAKIFKSLLIQPDSNLALLNGVSNALAAELAIISNFIFNNLWTFAAQKITSTRVLFTKFITFNFSSVITGILIPSLCISLFTLLLGDHLFLYQVIAIFGLTIPLNWIVYNTFIWKKK